MRFMSLQRALRWSGLLIAAGLLVQLLCLLQVHPLSFIAFACIGCPLLAAGIGLYLYSILAQADR